MFGGEIFFWWGGGFFRKRGRLGGFFLRLMAFFRRRGGVGKIFFVGARKKVSFVNYFLSICLYNKIMRLVERGLTS